MGKGSDETLRRHECRLVRPAVKLQAWLLRASPLIFCSCLSPHHASAQAATGVSQRPSGTTVNLGTIPVTAAAANSDGSTAQSGGLYVPSPTFGPFGATPARDLPFSTTSIPQAIIRDQQANSLFDAVRNDPSTSIVITPSHGGTTNVAIRGFQSSDYRIDDLPATVRGTSFGFGRDTERVDILKGANGLLYGFSGPAGTVNIISKKPLDGPSTQVTGSYGTRSVFGGAFDASRRFGPDNQFGIRLNLAEEGGNTPIDRQTSDQFVGAAAFDWRPRDGDRLWLNFARQQTTYSGLQPGFNVGNFAIPSAPDASKQYGTKYSLGRYSINSFEGGGEWELAPWLSARGAIGHFENTLSPSRAATGTLIDNLGNYNFILSNNHQREGDTSGEFVVSPHFNLGVIKNRADIGFEYADSAITVLIPPNQFTTYTGSNLRSPTAFDVEKPLPVFNNQSVLTRTNTDYRSFLIRDTLDITKYATLVGGAAFSRVQSASTGTASVNQETPTPSGAILLRPFDKVTLYGSYIQALQAGQLAGTSFAGASVINAGSILPPFVSTQYEAGVKYEVSTGLELTGAVFQIEQPNAVYLPANAQGTSYTFSQEGQEVHKGVELTAIGRLTKDLTVFSGISFLQPKIIRAQTAALNGKAPQGVPYAQGSVFAEYNLPFLGGMTLLGGVYYVGTQEVDLANTKSIRQWATVDVGLKYSPRWFDRRLTARAYVRNLFNTNYWQSARFGQLQEGDPISARFEVAVNL